MKNFVLGIKTLMVLGIIFSFIGVSSVLATRAQTGKGTGCFIRVGTGDDDYAFDGTCTAHDVLKMDDDGNLEFYVYQDHGQLPEGSWRPSQTHRETFEQCLQFDFGIVCGTVRETVSPSGEYKSSFKSH